MVTQIISYALLGDYLICTAFCTWLECCAKIIASGNLLKIVLHSMMDHYPRPTLRADNDMQYILSETTQSREICSLNSLGEDQGCLKLPFSRSGLLVHKSISLYGSKNTGYIF